MKLVVGLFGGSVSVLSEAAHSLTDLIASAIAFMSVRVSDTPPDADHPYGHGKIESISGLAEALLIVFAALYIIHESVQKLLTPGPAHTNGLNAGLAIMALSALVNFFLSRHLQNVGRAADSLAIEADGKHLQTDVFTSLGVFLGLGLTRLTGLAWFDPLTALLVAAFIMITAYRMARDVMQPLLDASLPIEEEAAIQHVLERSRVS